MHKLIFAALVFTVAAVVPIARLNDNGRLSWNEAIAAPDLATQTSSAGGVTIKVTPKNMERGAAMWDFTIVLDTHSVSLSDDLVKSSLLLDGAGGQYTPFAWDGAPPDGHHRQGVLRFKPITPQPQAIELQITRPGETAPRSLRWQLQ
jgi:hypothetical protein